MDYQEAHHFLFIQDELNRRQHRRELETMRIQTYYLSLPNLKKKTSIQKFMPFYWDNSKPAKPLIQDEGIFQAFEKMLSQRKQTK